MTDLSRPEERPVGPGKLDWLTLRGRLSLVGQVLEMWRSEFGSWRVEQGGSVRGYGASEVFPVPVIGRTLPLFRKREPRAACREYGDRYEGLEVASEGAEVVGGWVRHATCGDRGVATRLDVAFDFDVEEAVSSVFVREWIRPWVERGGRRFNCPGEEGTETVYDGSRKCDRLVRIYRRDRKPGGPARPVLRVELELKGARAQAVWLLWLHDEVAGIGAAAAHVYERTGLVVGELGGVPVHERRVSEPVMRLYRWVQQNAAQLVGITDVFGVDALGLCREWADRPGGLSRMTEWRRQRDAAEWSALDPERVTDDVRGLLRIGV